MGKKGPAFYAVRRGRQPGVYLTWEECLAQVTEFRGPAFKKFPTEEEAWNFVGPDEGGSKKPGGSSAGAKGSGPNKASTSRAAAAAATSTAAAKSGGKRRADLSSDEDEEPAKRMKATPAQPPPTTTTVATTELKPQEFLGDVPVVYTDGCCTMNGKHGACAGIGVYWGDDSPLNLSEKLQGRQTNQRAEIIAACRALEQAHSMKLEKLVLYTDSKFTINGITKWVKNWKKKGWVLSTGGPVVNKEDFERLDKLNEGIEVSWMYVPGHSGHKGNEAADKLAKCGSKKKKS
uniref:Ribonuclease H1 n=1 Tax=Petromyzon marinus TaxID=7757 RepID=S4RD12_PETMA